MYKIILKNKENVFETTGYTGLTCERDLQKLAADIWGEGIDFTISAPSIGLSAKSISSH